MIARSPMNDRAQNKVRQKKQGAQILRMGKKLAHLIFRVTVVIAMLELIAVIYLSIHLSETVLVERYSWFFNSVWYVAGALIVSTIVVMLIGHAGRDSNHGYVDIQLPDRVYPEHWLDPQGELGEMPHPCRECLAQVAAFNEAQMRYLIVGRGPKSSCFSCQK